MKSERLKIVRLTARNVKRLRAVEIRPDPDGRLVVVSGRNGQGKSSVLDAIWYALAGRDAHCPEPIRRGEESAEVVVDLGEIVVRRTFTASGGGTLTVDNAEGARYRSPQALLDGLVGALTFDPLEFTRLRPELQAEVLRGLVGLDFSALDQERASVYSARTERNRTLKALEARLAAIPEVPDAPVAEGSYSTLLSDLDALRYRNAERSTRRARADALRVEFEEAEGVAEASAAHLEEVQRTLERERLVASECKRAAEAAAADVIRLTPDEDERDLIDRIAGLEAANVLARQAAKRLELTKEVAGARAESDGMTSRLTAIDSSKETSISKAEFPVPGLGFSEAGVTLDGIPFEQSSSAEQLRVSVAIGLASHPTLRVALVRDGSLLDDGGMALLAEVAAEHDAQLWIERVEDGNPTVVIEDGSVAP